MDLLTHFVRLVSFLHTALWKPQASSTMPQKRRNRTTTLAAHYIGAFAEEKARLAKRGGQVRATTAHPLLCQQSGSSPLH